MRFFLFGLVTFGVTLLGFSQSVRADLAKEVDWQLLTPGTTRTINGQKQVCFSILQIGPSDDKLNLDVSSVERCCPPGQLPTGETDPKKQSCKNYQLDPTNDTCSQKQLDSKSFEVCAQDGTVFPICCPDQTRPVCSSNNDRNKQRCVADHAPDNVAVLNGQIEEDVAVATQIDAMLSNGATMDEEELSVSLAQAIATSTDTLLSRQASEGTVAVNGELAGSTDAGENQILTYEDSYLEEIVLGGVTNLPELQWANTQATSRKGNSALGCQERIRRAVRNFEGLTPEQLYQIAAAIACCSSNFKESFIKQVRLSCALTFPPNDDLIYSYKYYLCIVYAELSKDLCDFEQGGYQRLPGFFKKLNASATAK